MSQSFHFILFARARAMRKAPTFSEQLLWSALKGSQLGVAFRRQIPIARYIADFCAPSIKLVVEVDGGCHQACQASDARRDRDMKRLGYRVLRLPAAMVERGLPRAAEAVRAAIKAARNHG